MAEHIDAIIKIRRGLDADRRTIVFDQGEIAYSSDIKRVFIGDGTTVGAFLVGNLNTIGTSPSPYAVNKDLFYDKNTCIMYMLSNASGPDALVNYARVTPIADNTSIAYNNGVFSVDDAYLTQKITTYVTTALPKATNSTLGGIKVGTGLSVAGDGTLALNTVTPAELANSIVNPYGGLKVDSISGLSVETKIHPDITTSSTLGLSASNRIVGVSSANAITISVPADSTTNYDIGTNIVVYQKGIGQVTLSAAAGVTMLSNSSKVKLTGQYSSAALFKLAVNTWLLGGDLTA